ncbi:hypothetical protein, partial [Bradyrhizobium japonicum]|uniref:hypothetical protein n=1 Tax=Bradyrhizobium japonicum TaxID=375 RepID=UPI001AEC4DBF
LHQAKTELLQVLLRVAIHKLAQIRRHVGQLKIATTLDLAGNVLGNIFLPAFGRVEGDYPDRLAIFSGKQILDAGFQRPFKVCFSPGIAIAAKVACDQVDSLVTVRGDRHKPSGLTHKQLTQQPGFNLTKADSFLGLEPLA